VLHELMQWSPEAPTNGSNVIRCNSLTAVDGDTIKCDGVNMRDMGDGKPFVSGYDTPEIRRPKCQQELELARTAKARMQELLETPGVQVRDSGKVDRYKRPLVWIILPDGRSVGSLLIAEGLARGWTPESKADWCAR
jgi:endonuclease YncB( thermonuclease family)